MIPRAFRLLAFLAAAALMLMAGAAAGGAFAQAHGAEGLPARGTGEQVYPAAAGQVAVGDALRVNGQPMQLSIFFTADGPERVVRFYAAAFRARGLVPVLGPGHVSAFDPRDGWQRFVSALSQPTGETLVMAGAVDARRPPRLLNGAESAGLPAPPQSRGFLGYASEDAGTSAQAAQFVSPLAPAGVASFYRKELIASGWAERGAGPGWLEFARGHELLSVALQALSDDKGCAVFVTRTTGGIR